MKVIKILLEFEGWDPNGSKKTLKKCARIFTPKPHPQPGLLVFLGRATLLRQICLLEHWDLFSINLQTLLLNTC